MQRIALVDDDRNLLGTLSMLLESEGYRVDAFTRPDAALRDMRKSPPDLAVLDVRMPAMDGFDLLARLRNVTDIPVVMLTAQDSECDEVLGLGLGADDFVRKPFSGRVLLQRLRRCLQRSLPVSEDRRVPVLERGPLIMDANTCRVSWRGCDVKLSALQFDILRHLALHPDRVFSREQILTVLHGPDSDQELRAVDSQIKRVRQRFQAVDHRFRALQSIYGVGYRFSLPAI